MRSDISVLVSVVHVENRAVAMAMSVVCGFIALLLCPAQAERALVTVLRLLINESVHRNQELLPSQLSVKDFLARENAEFSLI